MRSSGYVGTSSGLQDSKAAINIRLDLVGHCHSSSVFHSYPSTVNSSIVEFQLT